MAVREKFEQALLDLQKDFVRLSDMAISALDKSVDALLNQDVDTALSIIENDHYINRLEEEINDRVILLIAKQQPVATDLRRLVVMIKAASDIERIGDYAVNIAKETIRIGKDELMYGMESIIEMRTKSVRMLREVMEAFSAEDVERARQTAELDDEIDRLYGETIQQLLKLGAEKPQYLSQVTQLSFICRYLERSADHATNIAEQLAYLVKGRHYVLNN